MSQDTRTKKPHKKPYAAPRFVRYGDVRVLTQTGSGAATETMTMQPMRMGSDRSYKEHIVRIDEHPLGIGLYLFDYKPEYRDAYGHGRQFGVMADEVEAVLPQAVSMSPAGHKVVDYTLLGIARQR